MSENLVVAHGGGPTAVINASLAGVIRQARSSGRVEKIYAAKRGIEGVLTTDLLELSSLTESELERLYYTPSSAIGTCRYKVAEKDYGVIIRVLRELGAKYFLYNGGNDSMDTCKKVAEIAEDINVIGIPKTVDNDLAGTDHSPGFGSAARYYAISSLELALDVHALDIHVCVMEVMGRNTGWLTAATTLARQIGGIGPELTYVPEQPFVEENFLEDIRKKWKEKGERGFVVTVSEGLIDVNGVPLVSAAHKSSLDSFGHSIPGNISHYLSDLISTKLGIRSRSEKPGLLGRVSAACVSDIDRREAYEAGAFAVKSAMDGRSGLMVGFRRLSNVPYSSDMELVPLKKVANVEKKLPDEYIMPSGSQIAESFCSYALPLVGHGFPEYLFLP